MKEIVLKTTKRKAIPYIVNLKCNCGGTFHKIDPIQYNINTKTIKLKCDKCEKIIDSKQEYPQTLFISNEPEEEHGEIVAYEGIVTVNGL